MLSSIEEGNQIEPKSELEEDTVISLVFNHEDVNNTKANENQTESKA